jgi:hypothetical protein
MGRAKKIKHRPKFLLYRAKKSRNRAKILIEKGKKFFGKDPLTKNKIFPYYYYFFYT